MQRIGVNDAGDGGPEIHWVGPRARAEAYEREMMEKLGWYWHYVLDDPQPPFANIHTHGFEKTFGQPDVQIVFPLPPEMAQGVLNSIVDLLKKGVRLEPGKRYAEVLQDFEVEFALAEESGRRVLRFILPDKDGFTARGLIAQPYAKQWEGTIE